MVTQADFHRHFELAGHHGFMEDVKVQVIDRIFGESRVREGFWQGRSQWGGAGGRSAPQQTICRKILLSCRNFCVLNN